MQRMVATGEARNFPPVLWALLFGNFVIGTGVMVLPGTLNELGAALQISVSEAGLLISAGALMMCLCAPIAASVVAGWDRRYLLSIALAWYGALHVLCALSPDYPTLMVLRVLAVVSPAVFTPQAAACVRLLVPAEQMGRAITFVFLGWSVASVVGMPMASLIGGTFGWRYAFGAVGVLGFMGSGWVWFSMRSNVRPPALSVQSWRQTLGSKPLMLCILVTVLYSAGQFVLFSYFAPYFKFMLNISPAELSMLFACFGTFGLVGNVIMTRYIDRWGAPRCIMIAMASMALSLLIWPWGVNLAAAALVSIPWALGCFSANSAQQARLAGIAPALASATIALNTSAMYAGQAAGSATGGWLISHGMLASLHWFGFGGLLLAMLLSWRASTLGHIR